MIKKILLIILFIFFLAALFSAWKILGPSVAEPEGKFLFIKTGTSFGEMKEQLRTEKIIKGTFWFDKTATLLKFKIARAGKYELKNGMSILQLIRLLKNGKQTPVNLVITKIRLKETLARNLGRLFEFDSLQAIQYLTNTDSLKPYKLDSNTVMSAVLPNTYRYYWNTTPDKVFKKLYAEWQKFWNEERKQKAARLGLTPLQVSVIASIIDEESNYAPEKSNIASVYLNRIKKNMPLQADPTVKFALRDFGLKRIYQKHLAVESPYNTYRKTGLPPGPICTPQPATIDAVLNSPETKYLYFVAKNDFSGAHVFTTNYADHLKKAKEYQQALNKQDSIRKASK
ncbi:MAG TPA: endolytic transglycosylase MltG [Chitinophagaceae bacterium]|nr:endolytic transglycosylase MltG [Chitinophagaceae bacterium]